jgi:aminoglycoside 3-N-acetyltransferase
MSEIRVLLKRLFANLPPGVQQHIRRTASRRRAADVAARKERTQVTADEILRKVAKFDLSRDFIIHGSISSIGKLDCSVPELLQRWLVNQDLRRQTILCPALPYKSTMMEYLDRTPRFDVRSAPNAMGAISNLIMAMDGARRSLHPTHSCIAVGKDAEFYVLDHELDPTPFGRNSPYRKLTERRGQIVMFGVGLNSVTNFHVYEDMLGVDLPFQVYAPDSYAVTCVDTTGRETTVSTRCHDQRQSAVRECEQARQYLLRAGCIRTESIGEAELSVINAHSFTVTLLQMLLQGHSIYGHVSLSTRQKIAVEHCLDDLL